MLISDNADFGAKFIERDSDRYYIQIFLKAIQLKDITIMTLQASKNIVS